MISTAVFQRPKVRRLTVAAATHPGNRPKFQQSFRTAAVMAANDTNEGLVRAAKDIAAGSVGGIAQVLTGQPFDIVKVHPPTLRPPFSEN